VRADGLGKKEREDRTEKGEGERSKKKDQLQFDTLRGRGMLFASIEKTVFASVRGGGTRKGYDHSQRIGIGGQGSAYGIWP